MQKEKSCFLRLQSSGFNQIGITLIFIIGPLLLGFTGCQSSEHRDSAKAVPPPIQSNKRPAVEAHVFEDEAVLKGEDATLGGTVENISDKHLRGLKVELELKRRNDQGTETRLVQLAPSDLAPGERGRYSLKLLSRDWSGARVLRILNAGDQSETAFKSSPGARRPPEIPGPVPAAANTQRRSGDFINSPDNPEVIR